jgi:hypothetical protein
VAAVEEARLRVTPAIVSRATASRYNRRSFWLTRLTIFVKMVFLANQKVMGIFFLSMSLPTRTCSVTHSVRANAKYFGQVWASVQKHISTARSKMVASRPFASVCWRYPYCNNCLVFISCSCYINITGRKLFRIESRGRSKKLHPSVSKFEFLPPCLSEF